MGQARRADAGPVSPDHLDSTPWAVMTGLFGMPGWVPHPRKRQGRAARAHPRTTILGIVNARRGLERDAGGSGRPDRPDLIGLPLEARDPEEGRAMDDRGLADVAVSPRAG